MTIGVSDRGGRPSFRRDRYGRRPSLTLERVAFKTDRLGEFVGRRELTAQIGHPPEE